MTDEIALPPFDVEVPVNAGRDVVWDAVTQPPVIAQWFGWDHHGLAAEIQQIFVAEATLVSPERMGWADGSYLEVIGDDDTARVRVVREGTPPAGPDMYDALEEGWKAFLTQLRFLIERRPAGERRTLHLTGETTGGQVLRLVDGDCTRVGSRVAWTVDPDGHLVVASGHLPLDSPDAAAMQVTVSAFGLAADGFAGWRDDWTKRWAPVAGRARITFTGSEDSDS